jgi:DNA-directed RNA polymerase specialized sigma24 family protein
MTLRQISSEHWSEADFRAVFLQHYARIVAILARLLGDRSDAEEVANDALWRLYRQPALQFDGNVGGWLYRTATNLGIDALRAAGRRRQHEATAGRLAEKSAATGPLDDLLREERCRRYERYWHQLSPPRRSSWFCAPPDCPTENLPTPWM